MDFLFDLWPVYALTLVAMAVNAVFALAVHAGVAVGRPSLAPVACGAVGGIAAFRLALAGAPWPLALLGGGVAGLALGLGFGVLALRQSPARAALASLGLVLLVHAVAVHAPLLWDALLQPGARLPARLPPAMLIAAAAAIGLGFRVLHHSWHGMAARALRQDPALAGALGLDPRRVQIVALAVSGLGGGLAGGLLVLSQRVVSADMFGLQLSILVLAAAILGGVNHWFGPVLAAAAATLLATLMPMAGPGAGGTEIAIGLAVLLVLRLVPGGVYDPAALRQWVARSARRAGGQPAGEIGVSRRRRPRSSRPRYHRVDR